MKHNDLLTFRLKDVDEESPTPDNNEATVIAFIPGWGFTGCVYFNGSNTWESTIVKGMIVRPTYWLDKLETEEVIKKELIAYEKWRSTHNEDNLDTDPAKMVNIFHDDK